jgi:hypothetical protein
MSPLLCAMNIFHVGSPAEEPTSVPTTEIVRPKRPKSSSVSSSAKSLPESPVRTDVQDDGCELVRLGSEVETKLSLGSSVFTPGSSLEENNTLTKNGTPLSSEARKKYFLDEGHRKAFEFSPEYTYGFDFYNKYLDLGEMRIRLPGFSIDMVKYWDEGLAIRYVCRSKDSSAIFFVVELDLV